MQVSALSDGRLLEQSEIFALNDKYRTQVMSPEVDDLDLFRRWSSSSLWNAHDPQTEDIFRWHWMKRHRYTNCYWTFAGLPEVSGESTEMALSSGDQQTNWIEDFQSGLIGGPRVDIQPVRLRLETWEGTECEGWRKLGFSHRWREGNSFSSRCRLRILKIDVFATRLLPHLEGSEDQQPGIPCYQLPKAGSVLSSLGRHLLGHQLLLDGWGSSIYLQKTYFKYVSNLVGGHLRSRQWLRNLTWKAKCSERPPICRSYRCLRSCISLSYCS